MPRRARRVPDLHTVASCRGEWRVGVTLPPPMPGIAINMRYGVGFREPGQTGGHAVLAESAVLTERTRTIMPEVALLGPQSDLILNRAASEMLS